MIKRYLRAAVQRDAALHLMLINQRLPKDFMQSRACIGAKSAYSAYRADQGGTQMGIILGIDVGGSTTKIVGLTPGGELISTMTVRAYDQITSLYGALGHYINANKFSLSDVERILVTGVGSSYLSGDIYGIPTQRIEEFSAIARGGLALAGLDEAVVVRIIPTSAAAVSAAAPSSASAKSLPVHRITRVFARLRSAAAFHTLILQSAIFPKMTLKNSVRKSPPQTSQT